jgi:hypothetical protein
MRRLVLTGLVVLLAACGGGGEAKDAGQKRYLVITHSAVAGSLASKPDVELVALGQQACAGLDASQPPDVIVTAMSADALPGSASFNEYSFILASAATELCPDHKTQMQVPLPEG